MSDTTRRDDDGADERPTGPAAAGDGLSAGELAGDDDPSGDAAEKEAEEDGDA